MTVSRKVSVCMITYGHQKFIRQAIESVLIQETDFDIELIISNDASPDGTDGIIKDIISNHAKGNVISYFNQSQNLGVGENFKFALQKCTGEFISLCEGDDFWTDKYKLQKQVKFLEENPEYIIHSGNAIYLSDNKELNGQKLNKKLQDQQLELKDFLTKNNLFTCTTMYRNIKFDFADIFTKVTFADWFLYVMLLKTSQRKAYKSIEVFSTYRLHSGGVMSALKEIKLFERHIFQVFSIKNYLKLKNFGVDDTKLINHYFRQIFIFQLEEKSYYGAVKTVVHNIKTAKFAVHYIGYLKILIRHLITKQKV